jgi:DNA-binding response OmpR family regulator
MDSKQAFESREREQMEVGVRSDAHFQLAGRVRPPLILLFTRDGDFAQSVRDAFFGTGAIVLLAQDIRGALQIVCQRGRELNLALMDFDDGCHGMTLLSALHTCHERLPVLVTTSTDTEHATAVAYANGARTCLNKPLHAGTLAHAIAELNTRNDQQLAA